MNKFNWQIAENRANTEEFEAIVLHPIAAQILANLDLKTEKVNDFLNPNYDQGLHSPLLFSDINKALDRLWFALTKEQKVLIFGDYDADGVCGSSIIYKILKYLKFDLEVYLPDREKEGYGLNKTAIDYAKSINCELIITVDCGISNYIEVEHAKSLGIDVVITDHHDVPEKVPEAVAIIHPGWDKNYPFSGLSGGGVAFKFVSAVINDERYAIPVNDREKNLKWLLDLVAISTVADMVPLIDENRTLVYFGLQVLKKTKNIGLQKMLITAQKDVIKADEVSIGYIIAPRINAAGRMAHANVAFKLLTTENLIEAIDLSEKLEANNIKRQSEVEIMVNSTLATLGDNNNLPVAVMVADGWPTGLIGLVASKLVEKYNRPALVITNQEDKAVGSGRAPADFNLIACLHSLKEYFDRYGGHPGAAGFSMKKEKVNEFIKNFSKIVEQERQVQEHKPSLNISAVVNGNNLKDESGLALAQAIHKFSPFGMGNPEPILAILGARIVSAKTVGLTAKHLQLQLAHEGQTIKAIAFGYGRYEQDLQPGQFINLAVKVGVNEWQGRCEVQCMVVDIKTN